MGSWKEEPCAFCLAHLITHASLVLCRNSCLTRKVGLGKLRSSVHSCYTRERETEKGLDLGRLSQPNKQERATSQELPENRRTKRCTLWAQTGPPSLLSTCNWGALELAHTQNRKKGLFYCLWFSSPRIPTLTLICYSLNPLSTKNPVPSIQCPPLPFPTNLRKHKGWLPSEQPHPQLLICIHLHSC